MVYINEFEDFVSRINSLYSRDPLKVRLSTKMRGANDELVLKVTNDNDIVSC